jgi:hypothetical protein
MEQELLASLIEKGHSSREIAQRFNKSPNSVLYWARKYGLRWRQTSFGPGYQPRLLPHKCAQCGETDPQKFYGNKRSMCGPCHNAYTKRAGMERRLKAIEQLGGHCCICGYNQYPCSLDFHHRDPKLKDTNYNAMRSWSWDRTLAELKKCTLLCKNCHAAVHAGFLKLPVRA